MSNDNNRDNGLVSGIILITIGIIALMATFFDFEIVWEELTMIDFRTFHYSKKKLHTP